MSEKPLTPRPAATVTLVRNAQSGQGFEVLMMQRSFQVVFVPGGYVFPGGALDPQDSSDDIAALCSGLTDVEASRRLGVASGGLAYWVAAIRESFEEAGILFACNSRGEMVTLDDDASAQRFHAYRKRVEQGEHTLAAMLRDEGLHLPLQHMAYFSHWITPPGGKRRYDTRFFVAVAPPAQKPLHDNGETINHQWVRPARALDLHRQGEFTMLPPAVNSLRFLAEHDSIESLMASARALKDIPMIAPRIGKDGRRLLPGMPGYEEAAA